MTFKKTISPLSLFMVAIGSMLGSGWLFGALYVSRLTGPSAILAWLIGGLLMLVVAFTFAELATTFPLPGSMTRFGEFSHGPMVNFMIAWTAYLATIGAAPIETMAILQYSSNYLPLLAHSVNGKPVLTNMGIASAAILMFVMCIINRVGINFFSRINTIMVAVKLIIPLVTIIVLFKYFQGDNLHRVDGFIPSGVKAIFESLPVAGVIFSFMGFESAIQLAGETKNPKRAIPIALIGSLLVAILIYMLLQLSFIGAIHSSYLSRGWASLDFPNSYGPFAGLAGILGLGWLVSIIYADAIFSPLTGLLIFTTSTARLTYGLSASGIFPQWLKKLNKNGVPMNAIFANYCIGLLFFLPFPTWQDMVGFLVSCIVISYSIGPLALISLRYNSPHLARPFRLPFALLFSLVAFYICNLIIFWTGWDKVSYVLVAIILGYLALFRQKDKWTTFWWVIPYLMGIGIISYCGSFGGGRDILPFGIDFFVIAGFSIMIYFASLYAGVRKSHVKKHMGPVKAVAGY